MYLQQHYSCICGNMLMTKLGKVGQHMQDDNYTQFLCQLSRQGIFPLSRTKSAYLQGLIFCMFVFISQIPISKYPIYIGFENLLNGVVGQTVPRLAGAT